MPISGPSGVAPTLKDGGACLVVGLDILLGEGDSEVGVAKWDNANQGSGEGWHDVALVGRWREVLELELSAGGGVCNGAVSNANADAGSRGVAVVNGGLLTEVDAGGACVGYSGVSDGKVSWVKGGWAAGQGDSKSYFLDRLYKIRGLSRLSCCCYIQPGASGGLVGHPVLVGHGTTHDVVTSGGGLVAFLGIGAGVASVPMSNTVSMGPAVASGVGTFFLLGSLLLPPLLLPPLVLVASWSKRALTWLVRVVL